MTGRADFENQLAAVLGRWGNPGTVENTLSIWRTIEVDAGVIATIAALRRGGIGCHLASNQHAQRARYMTDVLGYDVVFDRTFFSCRVGFAKPDRAYFDHVLEELALPAQDVLFIDDVAANVASARDAGIRSVHFAANAGATALVAYLAEHGIRITS